MKYNCPGCLEAKSTRKHARCRDCAFEYRAANPIRDKARKLVRHARERSQHARATGRGSWSRMKHTLKEFDSGWLTIDLVEAWLRVDGTCRVCKCTLRFEVVQDGSATSQLDVPSLDRIDPSKGYVEGNVWVLCFLCNSLKGRASPDFMRRCLQAIEKLG